MQKLSSERFLEIAKEIYESSKASSNTYLDEMLEYFKRVVDLAELEKNGQIFDALELAKIAEMSLELKKYKEAESDGRLVVLPCKAGDTLYFVDFNVLEIYKVAEFTGNIAS